MEFFGLDIGGTNIKGIVSEGGNIKFEASVATNARLGLDSIKHSIKQILQSLQQNATSTPRAIGIASAGNIDAYSGRVIYATQNLPNYSGFELTKYVESIVNVPVAAINDAYAALLGEMYLGALKESDYKNPVMLTFGTGLGGAYAQNGEIVFGKNFDAGRFGHIVLHKNGGLCTCGQRGCAEYYLSATALLRQSNQNSTADFFASLQKNGAILDAFVDNLTRLLQLINEQTNPDVYVFGGGLIHFWQYWLERILQKSQTPILKAKLKNNAGAAGAIKWAQILHSI